MKVKAILHIFAIDLRQMARVVCSTDKDTPVMPTVYLEYDADNTPDKLIQSLVSHYIPVHYNFRSFKKTCDFDNINKELVIIYSVLVSLEDMTNGYWITEPLWKFNTQTNITKEADKL